MAQSAAWISWVFLMLAILFEVAGTTAMKLAQGFTRPTPSIAVFACWGMAIMFLTLALKRIDISIAYAIWAGLGTALIAAIGVVAFGESLTPVKLVFLALIVVGVVGLKLAG